MTDEIQPVARAFEPDLLRVAGAHAEHLAYVNTMARRRQINALDLGERFAGELVWHERRQIEPLIRPLAQREHERLHGSSSFK